MSYATTALSAIFLVPLAALILALAHGGGPVGRLLASRPLVWGGAISYSFYMIHSQILQLIGGLLLDRLPSAPVLSMGARARAVVGKMWAEPAMNGS